jgi:putative ABC transport system substrate-binding protein
VKPFRNADCGLRIRPAALLIVALVLGTFVALASAALAQPAAKVYRIGFLRRTGVETRDFEAFRDGLRDLGYVEGQNILIEQRYAEGALERLPGLAAELVRLKVDVLVVDGTVTARIAKATTPTMPIVFTVVGDPVRDGLVASLARPGGNLTGTSHLTPEPVAKRLELLTEAVPRLVSVGTLRNPTNTSPASQQRLAVAARQLGLKLSAFDARCAREIDEAFGAMSRAGVGALLQMNDALFVSRRRQIVQLASKYRLPGMYEEREFVEEGGLMSYGSHAQTLWRRAATFVDKILKGAKPADLPVEEPTRYELYVNLKTAKALGLMIPQSVLVQADEVLQ